MARPSAGGNVAKSLGTFRVLAIAGAWIAVAAIAPGPESAALAADYSRDRIERVISTGLENIHDLYLEPVSIEELAIAGLNGLTAIDPSLTVRRDARSVYLYYGDQLIHRMFAPERRDTDDWAEASALIIHAARRYSPSVRQIQPEALYKSVFDSLLSRLDEFSRYAGAEIADDHRAARDGFGGIGIRIEGVAKGVRIVEVLPDTPAEDASLRRNDVITQIDGYAIAGLDQQSVVNRLRGRVNTTVQLTMDREFGESGIDVTLRREHIVLPTVIYEANGDAAVIRIESFNQGTNQSVIEAVARARIELADRLRGFVIDLRGNPGGLLEQAVSVADVFIPSGPILSTRGRHPDSLQNFRAGRDQDDAESLPVVVLVNGASASAAEIVAAALQDSGRSVVVGTGSYGKGTVQTVIRLPNNGELTLTWARLHAPSGYSFHRIGVIPTVCTARDAITAGEVIAQANREAARIAGLFARREAALTSGSARRQIQDFCQSTNAQSDLEMEVALELLRNPRRFARALRASRTSVAASPAAK